MIANYGVSAKTGLSIVSVLGLGVIESYESYAVSA